ncbi:hypothetical protein LWI29_034436 [Acer saccharum]|uniref:FAF domain-containing protein n=1 Tax=Acer saccharum TaxID=4024 RepID=A0AA39S0P1_ACESA|nr:hypothetical protein LWI29_034436 [Acer saccharum]KAK1559852.1 hypothetical protein Q3G72_019087 [Acer saccharum]
MSSSSSVRQGLQSCLEPRLIEPRVLRLKLSPPKSNFSPSAIAPSTGFTHPDDLKIPEENNTNTTLTANTENKNTCDDDNECDVKSQTNVDVRGWSFLQFLSNTTGKEKETTETKEKVYVHPLVKKSASKLSEKSLEMCTESLGSETGSQVSESSDETTEFCTAIDPPPKPRERKMKRSVSFPPPLTSISGSNGVQVRPHREGGRLVLEATVTTHSPTFFHAERSEGRLKLCILKDCPPNMEINELDDPEDAEEEEEEEEKEIDEDIEENNEKVRGENEMGVKKKLARPTSRCKEAGCRLPNWDSFWVATST